MTQAQTASIESLTRANIRQRIAKLRAREIELTEQLALLYKSGKSGTVSGVSPRVRGVHEFARQYLDGAGDLLPPLPADDIGDVGVQLEREGVRAALAILQSADLQAAAVEAAQKAVTANPEWQSLVRDWVIAAARWNAVEERAAAFRKTVGVDVMNAVSSGHLAVGTGGEIDLHRWHEWLGDHTIVDVAKDAIELGIVSKSDVDRAKRSAS